MGCRNSATRETLSEESMKARAALDDSERWQYRRGMPGARPARAFPSEFEIRKAPGSDVVTVRGLASSTASPYEMHDMFGTYTEVIQPGAFRQTLSQSPDVQLLENHAGRSMAYTRSGTLRLEETGQGLEFSADVNTARSDVRDMVIALQDGAYGECSFAFSVVRQTWSPDYDQRDITEVSMKRGDVSVCNFGANPNTGAQVENVVRALKRIESAAVEGRAIAPADVSIVSQALGWFTAIDSIVDSAQDALAEMLGVDNPDDDEPDEMAPARGLMTLDFARLLVA